MTYYDAALGDANNILKSSEDKLLFHNGKATYKQFSAAYSLDKSRAPNEFAGKWCTRKIGAPFGAVWSIARLVCHTAQFVFRAIGAIFGKCSRTDLIKPLFKCVRDVEALTGCVVMIFKDSWGLYLILESEFQKKCYDNFSGKHKKNPPQKTTGDNSKLVSNPDTTKVDATETTSPTTKQSDSQTPKTPANDLDALLQRLPTSQTPKNPTFTIPTKYPFDIEPKKNKESTEKLTTTKQFNAKIKAQCEAAEGNLLKLLAAKKTFDEACNKGLAKSQTYNIWLEAQCDAAQGDLLKLFDARRTFEDACEKKLANNRTYHIWIKAQCDTAQGDPSKLFEAKGTFEKACEKGLADSRTYDIWIEAQCDAAKGDSLNLFGAKRTFKESCEKGFAGYVTYKIWIKALCDAAKGNSLKLFDAKTTFKEACEKRLANYETYTIMLKALCDANNMPEAKLVFKEACKKGLTYATTYDVYLEALGKVKRTDEIAQVQQAKKKHLEQMKILGKANETFQRACGVGTPDSRAYNTWIQAQCNAKEVWEAERTFKEACEKGVVNLETYHILIKAQFDTDDMSEAGELFNQACKEGIATVETYHLMIKEQSSVEKIGLTSARLTFNKACEDGIATADTYNIWLKILDNAKESGREFMEIFNTACKNGLANEETYDIVIDSLSNAKTNLKVDEQATDEIEKAINSIKEAKRNFLEAQKALSEKKPKPKSDADGATDKPVKNLKGSQVNTGTPATAADSTLTSSSEDTQMTTSECNRELKAQIKANKMKKAIKTFDEACKNGLADKETYHIWIKALFDKDDCSEAIKIFGQACQKEIATVKIYHLMINGQSRLKGIGFNLAESTFSLACAEKIATAETYNIWLKILIDAKDDSVSKIFNDACKEGLADEQTYDIYIKALNAGKVNLKDPATTKKAIKDAKEAKRKFLETQKASSKKVLPEKSEPITPAAPQPPPSEKKLAKKETETGLKEPDKEKVFTGAGSIAVSAADQLD